MIHLLNAFIAEQQAVAIYEAEVFWRSGPSGSVFQEILAEERKHLGEIRPYLQHHVLASLLTPMNMAIGWIFGTFLSLLPRRLCFHIHVWAETDAAKTYETTAAKISNSAPQSLLAKLGEAASNEHQHAQRFRDLLATPR